MSSAAAAGAVAASLVAYGASAAQEYRATEPRQVAAAQGHAATTARKPRCYGAAARDPEHQPCKNTSLRRSVVPSPSDALITPSSPCALVGTSKSPEVCSFGAGAEGAVGDIALVGDSHAVHWRAALDVVAHAERWHGLSLYHSGCPYSAAVPRLREPAHAQCMQWREQVLQWFGRHPEVSTVFVSANSGTGVIARSGQDPFEAKVAGYVAAWQGLPATVQHVVVIGDVPHNERRTLPCVERVLARHGPTGSACTVPRGVALKPDPLAAAAVQSHSPRVTTVDLTPFMCDSRRCYPVVGGVLVHKDIGHLTRAFSDTLGPFLLRAVDRLKASWG